LDRLVLANPNKQGADVEQPIWSLTQGAGALVAAAVHNGHAVRGEVAARLALSEAERLREEDPYTGGWTAVAGTRIVGLHSRFEVDLNRPRHQAVYRQPEDARGLHVWKMPPPSALVDRSLAAYDAFYASVRRVLEDLVRRHGRFVVFDLHSYNHRRDGPNSPPADPQENPDVNVGTGTMVRARWAPVVDRFIEDLRGASVLWRRLDVRENVRFRGGYFPQWIHETFPETGCALAIEVKKFFMNEWTGEANLDQVDAIRQALARTVPGVLEALRRC
jgi:N-formylglutamate deformylase